PLLRRVRQGVQPAAQRLVQRKAALRHRQADHRLLDALPRTAGPLQKSLRVALMVAMMQQNIQLRYASFHSLPLSRILPSLHSLILAPPAERSRISPGCSPSGQPSVTLPRHSCAPPCAESTTVSCPCTGLA